MTKVPKLNEHQYCSFFISSSAAFEKVPSERFSVPASREKYSDPIIKFFTRLVKAKVLRLKETLKFS
jgi:hypothetical protein